MVYTVSPATVVRAWGLGSGALLGAFVFVDSQRLIWRNAAESCRAYGTLKPLAREPEDELFFGPRTRAMAGENLAQHTGIMQSCMGTQA